MKPLPPIGVIPRHIWLRERALELNRSIHEYVGANIFSELVVTWARELAEIAKELRQYGE